MRRKEKKIYLKISPQIPFALWGRDLVEIFTILVFTDFRVFFMKLSLRFGCHGNIISIDIEWRKLENSIYCQAIADILTKRFRNIPLKVL